MDLRLVEVHFPKDSDGKLEEFLEKGVPLGLWQQHGDDGHVIVRMLMPTQDTEALLDRLNGRFGSNDGFRVVLINVVATLPRPEEPEEEEKDEAEAQAEEKKPEPRIQRVNREELYTVISNAARPTSTFVLMVALSSIVAAIGLLRDNVAIIIGAMVIAPLLGPNVALALATALGDVALARRALKAGAIGLFLALAISALLGRVFVVDTGLGEIASRTSVGLGDIALALASGTAGALAFTTGAPAALIGVMVAVALLPPLATLGMLLGDSQWDPALGAFLLLATNIICVNLAGVVTFLLQGIRPAAWWEAERAKTATRLAIVLWIALLAALVVVVIFAEPVLD